ncbi:lysozyme family protein [Merdimonas faecis]|uniref:lysozyme family protein n=1 Tax=Merdimonas faecis TaxID=1653435 RepID=UPI00086362F2|nr:lysozyme family protein [Merdimonas faecis]
MGRTIKTRHVQKDIKVLDKTVTAAEHMKGAYIRTRDSAEQTQVKEQGNPVGYAEDQVMEKGERAARGTVQQTGKQGEKVIHAVREKGRAKKEAEAFREKNGEPSAFSFSSGTEKTYQPKEQMKNRAGVQTGRTVGEQAGKKGAQIRELPKQTVKTAERGERTIKTVNASVKTSGKAAVKGTGRTIKTAERTGRSAVRTTEMAARTAGQGARAAVVTTQRTAVAARQAAIAAVQTAKAAVKAAAAAVKAVIAATKALVSAILAGGWIVVLILVIVILFGALFSMVGGSNSSTVTPVSAEVEAYEPLIRQYARQYGIEEYVELIKAVMMQESGGQGTDPMQASECGYNTRYPNTPNGITDPEYSIDVGIQNLAACLREAGVENPVDMNHIKLALQGYNYGNGYISWAKENYGGYTYANAVEFSEMIAERNGWSSYGDKEYVSHVLRYYVFGRIPTGTGSQAIVQVALTQEGNGGDTYWSWYGFAQREEWCACFVSWCADQCGYIEAGVIPKFSLCSAGMEWFESQGQFMDGSYVPATGDLVFFDWENDGSIDHVGIVESVVDGNIYTVEGNSGDKVARRSYPIGYGQIVGYGVPAY